MNQETGDLTEKDSITAKDIYPSRETKNIEIRDITVGGKDGNLLYVLDKLAGVTILNIVPTSED